MRDIVCSKCGLEFDEIERVVEEVYQGRLFGAVTCPDCGAEYVSDEVRRC